MLTEMGSQARAASQKMANTNTQTKNEALRTLAASMDRNRDAILAANNLDIEAARVSGMSDAPIDRLTLTGKRVEGLSSDLRRVAGLPDPVGERFDECILPNGLKLWKRRVPLGVIGVVYESRPNVTIDVAGLAIKTGNAAILRGGKESIHSNRILAEMARQSLKQAGLPGRSRSIDRRSGSRAGVGTASIAPIRRYYHSARRSKSPSLLPRKQPDPGDHGRDRHLSHICG